MELKKERKKKFCKIIMKWKKVLPGAEGHLKQYVQQKTVVLKSRSRDHIRATILDMYKT